MWPAIISFAASRFGGGGGGGTSDIEKFFREQDRRRAGEFGPMQMEQLRRMIRTRRGSRQPQISRLGERDVGTTSAIGSIVSKLLGSGAGAKMGRGTAQRAQGRQVRESRGQFTRGISLFQRLMQALDDRSARGLGQRQTALSRQRALAEQQQLFALGNIFANIDWGKVG